MPAVHGFVERLAELSQSGVPFVCVTLVEAVGSTPQDTGSKMLVTAEGLVTGTVGGGRVEAKAIQVAQEMLRGHGAAAAPQHSLGDSKSEGPAAAPCPPHPPSCILTEWNLKRDVGMTCGGSVKLFFETYNYSDWHVVVFGAGHVAAALVACLAPLDCLVTCIDPRAEWLSRIPAREGLRKIQAAEPAQLVSELPRDAFVVCMTMGHATDRPILAEVFRQRWEFPFVGAIGSRAKRAVLVKELMAGGIARETAERFCCPIGLELGTNQPGEIAISVVAQLLQERDRWRGVVR